MSERTCLFESTFQRKAQVGEMRSTTSHNTFDSRLSCLGRKTNTLIWYYLRGEIHESTIENVGTNNSGVSLMDAM
jgi:hypothetical protein